MMVLEVLRGKVVIRLHCYLVLRHKSIGYTNNYIKRSIPASYNKRHLDNIIQTIFIFTK